MNFSYSLAFLNYIKCADRICSPFFLKKKGSAFRCNMLNMWKYGIEKTPNLKYFCTQHISWHQVHFHIPRRALCLDLLFAMKSMSHQASKNPKNQNSQNLSFLVFDFQISTAGAQQWRGERSSLYLSRGAKHSPWNFSACSFRVLNLLSSQFSSFLHDS